MSTARMHASTTTPAAAADTASMLFAGGPVSGFVYEASIVDATKNITTYNVACTPTIPDTRCAIPSATVVQGPSTWRFAANVTASARADYYESECDLFPADDRGECTVMYSHSDARSQVVWTSTMTKPFSSEYVTAIITASGRPGDCDNNDNDDDDNDDDGKDENDDSAGERSTPGLGAGVVVGLVVVMTAMLLW